MDEKVKVPFAFNTNVPPPSLLVPPPPPVYSTPIISPSNDPALMIVSEMFSEESSKIEKKVFEDVNAFKTATFVSMENLFDKISHKFSSMEKMISAMDTKSATSPLETLLNQATKSLSKEMNEGFASMKEELSSMQAVLSTALDLVEKLSEEMDDLKGKQNDLNKSTSGKAEEMDQGDPLDMDQGDTLDEDEKFKELNSNRDDTDTVNLLSDDDMMDNVLPSSSKKTSRNIEDAEMALFGKTFQSHKEQDSNKSDEDKTDDENEPVKKRGRTKGSRMRKPTKEDLLKKIKELEKASRAHQKQDVLPKSLSLREQAIQIFEQSTQPIHWMTRQCIVALFGCMDPDPDIPDILLPAQALIDVKKLIQDEINDKNSAACLLALLE